MLLSPNPSGRRGPGGGLSSRHLRPAQAALAAALGLSCALLPGCGLDDDRNESGPPPITVEVARIEPTLLQDIASFSGQLNAEHSVILRPEADGVVESVEFDEGQDVSKGDVLFRLRNIEQVARRRHLGAGPWPGGGSP